MNLEKKLHSRLALLFMLFASLGGVLLAVSLPVAAQSVTGTITDDEVNDVAKGIYCPVCANTPLDVCETQACADWRELIRVKLAQGETEEQIDAYFARQYGDRVLSIPPRRGINLLLWIAPVVALGLGFLFFSRFMRGLRTEETAVSLPSSPPPTITQTTSGDTYIDQVEAELKRL